MDIIYFAKERLRAKVRDGLNVEEDVALSCVECNDDVSLSEAVKGFKHCKFCRNKLGIREKVEKIDDKVRMAFDKLITSNIVQVADKHLRSNATISESELIKLVADEVVRGYPNHEVMIRYKVEQIITQYFDETKKMAF